MPPSARLSAVALPPGPLTERSPAELLFRLLFEAQCTCAKAAPVPPETLTPVSLPLLVCKFSDPPCLPRVLCPQAERSWSYLRKHPLSPRTLATAWFVFNRWVPGKARLKGAEALRVRGLDPARPAASAGLGGLLSEVSQPHPRPTHFKSASQQDPQLTHIYVNKEGHFFGEEDCGLNRRERGDCGQEELLCLEPLCSEFFVPGPFTS